jgi:DNA-binding transcriptional MerR regulator
MLKIRDFARLAEVSMNTLRYYDEIGLLKPIHVDPESGYRFYTMDQLPHLHRILAFKELGLGLTQIVEILDEGIPPDTLQGMLRLKQAQIQQHIQAEQEKLVRIEARLQSLEQGKAPTYEIVLKAARPITGVSLHLTTNDMADQTRWIAAIEAMLKRYEIKPIDHLLVLHSGSEDEHTPDSVEIVAPVDNKDIQTLITRSEGRLTQCSLPAIPHIASTLHHGHPALALTAYQALGTWIEQNGYSIIGPRRKIRLRRDNDLNDALTEIQFPVEKES